MSKILWLSWKDYKNPQYGGAEVIGHQIRTRLAQHGHTVVHVTAAFPNAKSEELVEGVRTIRLKSNRILLMFKTYLYYKKHLSHDNFDVIIEEVNTAPYFAKFYPSTAKRILFYHQLTGDVWHFEFPFPLNFIGKYLLEPIALLINSKSKQVIAMSTSTKSDLVKHGFNENSISIISEATDLPGLRKGEVLKKNTDFTVVYFGSLRKMKRPESVIRAFALGLKETDAKLVISGGAANKRMAELTSLVEKVGISPQVIFTGRISDDEKRELFKKSHVICMTSIKEGWGIVVMEAGLFETPAVVFDVDGLRDAVIQNETGIVVPNNNHLAFGKALRFLYDNPKIRQKLGKGAREFNSRFSFERTYHEFEKIIQAD